MHCKLFVITDTVLRDAEGFICLLDPVCLNKTNVNYGGGWVYIHVLHYAD